MRTLKIRKLYQLHGLGCPALGRSVRPRLQNLTIVLERLGAEGKQRIRDQKLAIRQGEERKLRGLILGSGSGRLHQYQDSTHARRRGRQDRLDLPRARIVVSPECIEKLFDRLLGRTRRRKICWVDRRERLRGYWGCCRRCGLRR